MEIRKADWKQIKYNWRKSLVGDEKNDVQNGIVATVLKRIESDAREVWSIMNKGDGIKILFGSEEVTATIQITRQYMKLEKLALAYGTYGTDMYGDATLKNDILYGLDWLYKNLYGTKEIENESYKPSPTSNWWDWTIGVPTCMCNVMMILEQEMDKEDISRYVAISNFYQKTLAEDCGRGAEARSYVGTISAVLEEDKERMLSIMEDLKTTLEIRDEGDVGIRSDYTCIFHQHFPYNGMYGVGTILERTGRIVAILEGTPFELDTAHKNNLCQFFYNVFGPIMYKGGAMAAFNGRSPEKEGEIGAPVITIAASGIQSSCFDKDDEVRLKEMIRRHTTDETLPFIVPKLSIDQANAVAQILTEDTKKPKSYTRTKVYAQGDRVVQHRNGYAFAISMSSSRIANYESICNCNQTGWYTSDGMVYMYVDGDINQYRKPYWENVNPYHMPGTTVDTQERLALGIDYGLEYRSSQDFVGAAELDGKYATAAMSLESFHNEKQIIPDVVYSSVLPLHKSTLTAKKAWFLLEGALVALGADINAEDGFEVKTIVENRMISDERIMLGEYSAMSTDGDKKSIAEPTWVHLENVGGYYFPQGGELCLQKTSGDTNFLQMWLEHGKNPKDKTYAYVLLPNKTEQEVQGYAENPDISVLVNSPKLQAVRERSSGLTGMIFWEKGAFENITVSEPIIVMTQEKDGEYIISLCDPTQKLEHVEVTVNNKSLAIQQCDKELQISIEKEIVTINADLRKSKGKTFTARFKI